MTQEERGDILILLSRLELQETSYSILFLLAWSVLQLWLPCVSDQITQTWLEISLCHWDTAAGRVYERACEWGPCVTLRCSARASLIVAGKCWLCWFSKKHLKLNGKWIMRSRFSTILCKCLRKECVKPYNSDQQFYFCDLTPNSNLTSNLTLTFSLQWCRA